MIDIDKIFSWKVRQKRAKLMLTKNEASVEIGISRKTFKMVETGELKKVTKAVYEKLVNWLLEEKEGD